MVEVALYVGRVGQDQEAGFQGRPIERQIKAELQGRVESSEAFEHGASVL